MVFKFHITTEFDFNEGITKDTNIYAKFELSGYELNWYDVTATGNVKLKATESIDCGDTVFSWAPTKIGYDFIGWYADDEFQTEFDFATEIVENTNIYAKFSIKTFTASFEYGTSRPHTEVFNYGEVLEYVDLALVEPESIPQYYSFVGWYTDNSFTTKYTFPITVQNTMNFVAGFTRKQATITWYDGLTIVDTTQVGKGLMATALTAPNKTYFSFDNWYTTSELTTAFNFENVITEDTDIYAKYARQQATITWYDGLTLIDTTQVGKGLTTTAFTAPDKANYLFDNWCITSDLTTAFDFNTPITGDINIYAKYSFNDSRTFAIAGEPWDNANEDSYFCGKNWVDTEDELAKVTTTRNQYTVTVDLYAGDNFQLKLKDGSLWSLNYGIGAIVDVENPEGTTWVWKDADGDVCFENDTGFGDNPAKWDIKVAEGGDGQYRFTLNTTSLTEATISVEKLASHDAFVNPWKMSLIVDDSKSSLEYTKISQNEYRWILTLTESSTVSVSNESTVAGTIESISLTDGNETSPQYNQIVTALTGGTHIIIFNSSTGIAKFTTESHAMYLSGAMANPAWSATIGDEDFRMEKNGDMFTYVLTLTQTDIDAYADWAVFGDDYTVYRMEGYTAEELSGKHFYSVQIVNIVTGDWIHSGTCSYGRTYDSSGELILGSGHLYFWEAGTYYITYNSTNDFVDCTKVPSYGIAYLGDGIDNTSIENFAWDWQAAEKAGCEMNYVLVDGDITFSYTYYAADSALVNWGNGGGPVFKVYHMSSDGSICELGYGGVPNTLVMVVSGAGNISCAGTAGYYTLTVNITDLTYTLTYSATQPE